MFAPRLIILQPTPYCNIDCSYCYLGNRNDRRLMSAAVVEAVREKVIARLARDAPPSVVWHAGEPTAAPVDWYEHAHERLAAVAPEHTSFAMQSNGVAIDARWIDFFTRSSTNVSLSIDGPARFHDARRRTRNGKPTWSLATRGLKRLQEAGFEPRVITVLHPDGLTCADEYFDFYRTHDITQVSFNIDEREGANRASSFAARDYKAAVTDFLLTIMERAYRDNYPLHVREVERIAQVLAGIKIADNEQVEPWASLVVAADGNVSTYSPEFMEAKAPAYSDFVFGNILTDDPHDLARDGAFLKASRHVAAGTAACEATCRYFAVCRGGSPVNKLCERGDLTATETQFCRLTTQAAADALVSLIWRKRVSTNWPPALATSCNAPLPAQEV